MSHHNESQSATELDNITYDIISTLAEKSDGLAVMEQYLADAEEAGNNEAAQVFRDCIEFDQKVVTRLMKALRTTMTGGSGGNGR